jgi:hypothetical protein
MEKAMRCLLVGLVSLMAVSQVAAQNYVCTRSNGTRYASNLPCPNPGFVYYGPTQTQQNRPSYLPPAPPAAEELPYMSVECSAMYEGVRTAASRGVNHQDIASLRRDFQAKCSENQSEARRQLFQSKSDERKAQSEQKQSLSQQAAQNKEQDDRKRVQCAEMRSSIASRKARTNLSDGEKNDLSIFEQRYRDRCY